MTKRNKQTLIEYVTAHTGLSQADLARELDVSRAQISKWKAGEYLPSEREAQLLKLAGLFDTVCTEWAIFAKTRANAEAWYTYLGEIVGALESGHTFAHLFDELPDIYSWHVIELVRDLGVDLSETAPATRLTDDDDEDGDVESTPLANLLFEVLENWAQLRDWIADNLTFNDTNDDADAELLDHDSGLEWCASGLGLAYVERETLLAIGVDPKKLDARIQESRKLAVDHISRICGIRTKHGLPITTDYFQLLYLAPDELAEQALFRPKSIIDLPSSETIKEYLPYGQQMILTHLECSAKLLCQLDEKLNRLLLASKE